MMHVKIENGHVYYNGQESHIDAISLSQKVKEVLEYMLNNNIFLTLEKRERLFSVSTLRPDLKTRLYNALMAEKLIRHRGL